jgi:transcriptional regulator with XRE-family HTH domain
MKGATTIQERLWELRKDKGLNLEELSKLTNISKSALASYESNDYKEINHGNLITLADFYEVSVDYLLCRTENREQINTPLTELHLNDEYFSHMVFDDINIIIRDIREAHKKDSDTAPQTTIADELKENLEAAEKFKGSRDEKLVILYCKQLGINYKNLSEEEFRWLIRILKKSKKMGTPMSQRKKR